MYNVELSVCHANAISKMLPLRYTLQIDRVVKNKKTNQKRKTYHAPDNKSRISREDEDNLTENNPVSQSAVEPVHTMSYDDMVKRAHKILIQLKKNKNSWPFL